MRDTRYSAICFTLILLMPAFALLASSSQQPPTSSGVTLVGCLIDEREFADVYGLAVPERSVGGVRQLVLVVDARERRAPGAPSVAAYPLTGPEENRLSTAIHRRVSLEGIIEPGVVVASDAPDPPVETTNSPTGAVGVTEDGSPAHEPADAIVNIRDGARARRPDERAASISELDRINVTTARVLGNGCGELFIAPASSPETAAITTRVASAGTTPVTATLIGCLVRRDADGTSPADGLTLLAAPRDDRGFLTRGAVPGSLPSGAGSGTVGTSGSVSREPVAYRLTGELGGLLRYVGQRIEVTGIADPVNPRPGRRDDDAAPPAPTRAETSGDTAHPTAIQHTLQVASFRTAAGVCR